MPFGGWDKPASWPGGIVRSVHRLVCLASSLVGCHLVGDFADYNFEQAATTTVGVAAGGAGGATGSGGDTGAGGASECPAPCLWVRRFGDGADQSVYAVTPSADGGILLAANVQGTTDFDGVTVTTFGIPPTGLTPTTLALVRLAADGSVDWVRQYPSSGFVAATTIATAPQGEIVVGGAFTGAFEIGDNLLSKAGIAVDPFIAKFDADGKPLWAQQGSSPLGTVTDIALDAAGRIYAVGHFAESIFIGGESFDAGGASNAAFLTRLSPDGDSDWFELLGNSSLNVVRSVALDGNDRVYTAVVSENDLILYRYDYAGDNATATVLSGSGVQTAYVAADASGAVVAGQFVGALDLGTELQAAGSSSDLFVARLDDRLLPDWSFSAGTSDDEIMADVTLRDGSLLITGRFEGTLDLANDVSLVGGGFEDAFLVELDRATGNATSGVALSTGGTLASVASIPTEQGIALVGTFEPSITIGTAELESAGELDLFAATLGGDFTLP